MPKKSKMKNLYEILLALHVISGFVALASGLVAMFTSKAGKSHRISGNFYFGSMTATCASALIMALIKPNPFLYVIAVFSYFSVVTGYRSLYLKKLHQGKQQMKTIDWTIGIMPILLILSLHLWVIFFNVSQRGMEYIIIGLEVVILMNCLAWFRLFFNPPSQKKAWMLLHFQGMGGGYIATATAFLVTNIDILPPLVLWITPSIIGGAIIGYTTAKYKRRFNKEVQNSVVY